MESPLRDFLLAVLISIIMTALFNWGYGGTETFPQWIVYLVSYVGTYIGVCHVIDVFSGRK